MDSQIILLGKNKRRGARNETNQLPLQIESTSKPLVRMDVKSVVDLYDVYRQEYAACQRYRITLTIKPYCTNVLYNVCTEVVKDEGSENCIPVSDIKPVPLSSLPSENDVYGLTTKLYRNYMVTNTEYSSPEIGFSYLPGYDIFNNHTLRNLSFRPILPYSENPQENRINFNTLRDYLRTKDGKTITFFPRFSKEDIENNTRAKMHVYEHSSVLPFIDGSSAEANLVEENGWYGFVNSTSLSDKDDIEKPSVNVSSEHEFSHTVNNLGNCEFVDMFPDRTRYSFVPKYNEHQHRYEKNWDVFLTYPWKNFYEHNLVKNVRKFGAGHQVIDNGTTNALAIMRGWRTKTSSNRETMLFRTFTKHGLSLNDKVAIYVSIDAGGKYERLPREYTVDYLGDVNGNNTEYFFGITSKTLLNDAFAGKMDVFYSTGGSNPSYSVSHEITEVPTVAGNTVLTVYYYETDTDPAQNYPQNATFDNMPKTVNRYYPESPNIRVWDKGYVYMWWDEDSDEYVDSVFNPEVQYGDWNTFTDTPSGFEKEYIRVKTYNYYIRNKRNYRQNPGEIDDLVNRWVEQTLWQWRFVKVVNGVDCQYYIREFRKVPNLKYSEEPLPEGMPLSEDNFNEFIQRNAMDDDGSKMLEFDAETYKLAFAKTLYGDDVAQVTFLDNIDIANLTDNLGRPVTEIYSTIVKRNKGYQTWYENIGEEFDKLQSDIDVEYSRCFGSVTTGFECLDLDDVYDRDSSTRELKGFMSSAYAIYRDSEAEAIGEQPFSVEDWDTSRDMKEITESDDVFYGDVVEYNPIKCVETVLADACFRFNTAQREIGRDGENEDFDFSYDELLYDDYDPTDEERTKPFLVKTYRKWFRQTEEESLELGLDEEHDLSVRRKEGYYYKPHTRIQLLRYSENVEQGSHRSLRIRDCRPIQSDAIYIKVTTSTMHGVGSNTVLYLCNGDNWSQMTVSTVYDNYSFSVVPPSKDDAERNGVPYVNWVDICEGVRDGSMKLRVRNEKIPYYASRVGENLFMWRDIINPVDLRDHDSCKHPFSNNAFYVDAIANVFLRRQDPEGINGLYEGKSGDIEGKILPTRNNKYKTETEIKCY